MSENATENTGPADQSSSQDQAAEASSSTQETSQQSKADETDWKAEARKWEQRAKENTKKAQDLERQQRAAMPEAERAIAEAEARGRTTAVTDFGKRLARTQFDALAGRRNADFDTSQALEYVDLSKFVGEDGEPDSKAIAAAVERLVPEAAPAAPSFDGGARKASKTTDMNTFVRGLAGRG